MQNNSFPKTGVTSTPTHPTLYILFSIEEDHGRFGLVMQQNIEFIPFASLELTHPLATMN